MLLLEVILKSSALTGPLWMTTLPFLSTSERHFRMPIWYFLQYH